MGLAEQKNRIKLSNDPQNTAWANNTERFGHRILTGQGWAPGKSLGAKDAAHAAHYTAASQSHIRVFLKDDNLGLGAKRGSERAENFGLAGLESILGRLNGREEDVKKEEARREEVEKRAYVYRKYGLMNFISGGFLVGDRIVEKDAAIKAEPAIAIKTEIKSESESDASEDNKNKKRKRDASDAAGEGTEDQSKLKRKKKSMDLREEASKQSSSEKSKKDKKDKKDKKEKKDKSKKSKKDKSATSDPEPMTSDAPTPASDPEPLTDKSRRKAEKKARKEEKKLKKALKKAAKKAAKANDSADDSSSESDDDDSPSSSAPATGTSTPSMFAGRGVQAARHRHILMKKRASMDPQALKEIFMIKTPA